MAENRENLGNNKVPVHIITQVDYDDTDTHTSTISVENVEKK